MLDWPCHPRGQIKRSLYGGEAGEFVKIDSAVCLLVKKSGSFSQFLLESTFITKFDRNSTLKWNVFTFFHRFKVFYLSFSESERLYVFRYYTTICFD